MPIHNPNRLVMLLLLILGVTGCAATLPPTYAPGEGPEVRLNRKVLAVAAGYGTVVAATSEGLIRRTGEGWEEIMVPGISSPSAVTALALTEDTLLVGTRDDGLRILAGDEWEVRNVRYGSLPDNHVTAIAVEMTASDGLAGDNLWVATRGGLAVRRDGEWRNYTPGDNWLRSLVGDGSGGESQVYITSGFRYGPRSDEPEAFTPVVTAIGIGPDRVVLGSTGGNLAVLAEGAFTTLKLQNGPEVLALLVDENALWCGTDQGLFWGGLHGKASGRPYPGWQGRTSATGILFGSRDSRPFHYTWYRFGYNSARVTNLARDGSDGLWVMFNTRGVDAETFSSDPEDRSRGTTENRLSPVPGTRRFVNVDEYIRDQSRPHYESYAKSFGIGGQPEALAYDSISNTVWLGTTSGLLGLTGATR